MRVNNCVHQLTKGLSFVGLSKLRHVRVVGQHVFHCLCASHCLSGLRSIKREKGRQKVRALCGQGASVFGSIDPSSVVDILSVLTSS